MLRIDPITCRTLRTVARGTVAAGAVIAASLAGATSAHGAVAASFAAGQLTVNGDAADDSILVSCVAGNADVTGVVIAGGPIACAAVSVINVVGGGGNDSVQLQGVLPGDFTALTVVTINGGDGNDTVQGSGIDDTISGEGGDDLLIAVPGAGDDTLFGNAGSDTVRVDGNAEDEVFTLRPSELVLGGGSVDLVGSETTRMHFATAETLELNPGGEDDTVLGGDLSAASELVTVTIDGGPGGDLLDLDDLVGPALTAHGGPGPDTLTGSAGPDVLVGGAGGDFVTGGDGADLTTWAIGEGNDTLIGGAGSDTHRITGSEQSDAFTLELRMQGGAESVRITQGGGKAGDALQYERIELDTGGDNDGLEIRESFTSFSFGTIAFNGGGAGNDSATVRGTADNDQFTLRSVGATTVVQRKGSASYTLELTDSESVGVRGRKGNDRINAAKLAAGIKLELFGGGNVDTLIGGAGDDRLKGGRGNDVMRGRGGDDRLWGHRGRDKMLGGPGADTLLGSSGKDVMKGGAGADRLLGGRGPDDIGGGAGDDLLDGGGGDDLIFGLGGEDELFGRGGSDTLIGGAGADTLDGGRGVDTARNVDEPPGTADLLRRIELIE